MALLNQGRVISTIIRAKSSANRLSKTDSIRNCQIINFRSEPATFRNPISLDLAGGPCSGEVGEVDGGNQKNKKGHKGKDFNVQAIIYRPETNLHAQPRYRAEGEYL